MPITIQSQSNISTAKTIQSQGHSTQAFCERLSGIRFVHYWLSLFNKRACYSQTKHISSTLHHSGSCVGARQHSQILAEYISEDNHRLLPSTDRSFSINFDLRGISVVPSDSSSSLSNILRVPNLSSPNFNLQLRQRGAPTDSLAIPSS